MREVSVSRVTEGRVEPNPVLRAQWVKATMGAAGLLVR